MQTNARFSLWTIYLHNKSQTQGLLNVFVNPVNSGVDISDDDGDGRGGAEVGSSASGHQTIQDISLRKGVSEVILEYKKRQLNKDFYKNLQMNSPF